jgi:hypothetical protein
MLKKILYFVLILESCTDNNEIKSFEKKENGVKKTEIIDSVANLKFQLNFYHQFCNEKVLVKVGDSIIFDYIVTSAYCSNKDVSHTILELNKNWNELEVILPKQRFKHRIQVIKNKNIMLYFHDSKLNSFLKRDTIFVRYWDKNSVEFED